MTDHPDDGPKSSVIEQKSIYGILAAVILGTAVVLLPAPDGLSPEGKRMGALFLVVLVLWATEAIPTAVTSLLALALQPILGVSDMRTAIEKAMSPVFFFVIAMFIIATAMIQTGLARRFALWLLARAGTRPRRIVFAFMAGTATLSAIMSDVPACAIFMVMALGVLDRSGARPGASRLGKALMIGVPVASLIGGVATPAGSSINILGIHFIEEYGKVRIPFLSWMVIGIPMALVLVPAAYWTIVRFFPPEEESIGDLSEIHSERAVLGRMATGETRFLVLLFTMIVLWILSTWDARLDLVLIALGGAIIMFLPGMRLITWRQAEEGTSWETIFMIAGVSALGAASVETGFAGWLVDATVGDLHGANPFVVVGIISTLTVLIHLVLPIGPVVNAVLIPPIALLAISAGESPALYSLPVAFSASAAFLLPLDAVCLITYSKGYYRMLDMFLPGMIISLVWVVWITILMVTLAPLVGLF